jgi:hypothetical protein
MIKILSYGNSTPKMCLSKTRIKELRMSHGTQIYVRSPPIRAIEHNKHNDSPGKPPQVEE